MYNIHKVKQCHLYMQACLLYGKLVYWNLNFKNGDIEILSSEVFYSFPKRCPYRTPFKWGALSSWVCTEWFNLGNSDLYITQDYACDPKWNAPTLGELQWSQIGGKCQKWDFFFLWKMRHKNRSSDFLKGCFFGCFLCFLNGTEKKVCFLKGNFLPLPYF